MTLEYETFSEIIDLWPTRRLLAADLDVTPEAVSRMHKRNSVHHSHWDNMEKSAEKHGIEGITYKLLSRVKVKALNRLKDQK